MKELKVGFIGAGNMALALGRAIAERYPDIVAVPYDVRSEAVAAFRAELARFERARVEPAQNAVEAAAADVVFLAVKPQTMESVLQELAGQSGLFVSIAAGLPLAFFQRFLPEARVIRIMPNTPCLAGEMAAGMTAGRGVSEADRSLVRTLLEAAGRVVELPEEKLDAVTAVSGSGPAFWARLAEAFIDAGREAGLDDETARTLVLQTMKGTAVLLEKNRMEPGDLVEMVSSPGGTTVAGRRILESSDFREIISGTVRETVRRSKELGS